MPALWSPSSRPNRQPPSTTAGHLPCRSGSNEDRRPPHDGPPPTGRAGGRLTRRAGGAGGGTPRRYWPPGLPGAPWCSWGTDAPESSAMGRPARRLLDRAAAEGGTRSRRVRPPASIALDRDHGQPPATVGDKAGTRLRRVLLR